MPTGHTHPKAPLSYLREAPVPEIQPTRLTGILNRTLDRRGNLRGECVGVWWAILMIGEIFSEDA